MAILPCNSFLPAARGVLQTLRWGTLLCNGLPSHSSDCHWVSSAMAMTSPFNTAAKIMHDVFYLIGYRVAELCTMKKCL